MRLLLFFILLFFQSTLLFSQTTKHVFIIVLDGARYSETIGDSAHLYIPYMWNHLKPKATINTSFFNNGWTYTVPGHASIVTGKWQFIANDGSEHPHTPTLFELYRKQINSLENENYVITGKLKLNVLCYSTDSVEYGQSYKASNIVSATTTNDTLTFLNAKQIATDYHPKLALINFSATDVIAHSGNWSNYTNTIKVADSLIYELWKFLESDSIYKNTTTLIITNDHGRHLDTVADGFVSHGDYCMGCKHIMYLEIGPDTPENLIDTTTKEQTDIAARVAYLLKFELPSVTTNYSFSTLLKPAVVLNQNSPNPFVKSTAIKFNIAIPQQVGLSIYSSDNKLIKTLINKELNAGDHIVTWFGDDASGKIVTPGLYYCRLKTQGEMIVKTMIKLK